MSRIYWIKHVPSEIKEWFKSKFSGEAIYHFEFYVYYVGNPKEKYYGCEVSKNGKLWDTSCQGTLEHFKQKLV